MSLLNNYLPLKKYLATQDKRASSASVIIEDGEGRLLVVKASYKNYWSLPGGLVDADELPRQAATREVREEIGIDIKPDDIEFVAVIARHSTVAYTYSFVFRYTGVLDSPEVVKIDNQEIIAVDWVTRQQVRSRERGLYNQAVDNWASEQPRAYIEFEIKSA